MNTIKKLLCLWVFPLILFFGCTDEGSDLTNQSPELKKISSSKGMLTAIPIEGYNNQTLSSDYSLKELNNKNNNVASARMSNNHSANGHFTTLEGNTISFSNVENSGGAHGILRVSGNIGFQVESICISVEGNRAVIGGVISKVENCECAQVGESIYFLIEDNGEGVNATDRYFPYTLSAGIDDTPYCSDVTPSYFLWLFENAFPPPPEGSPAFTFSDVSRSSDQIQIK